MAERLALQASNVAVGSVFYLDFPILYLHYGNKELTLPVQLSHTMPVFSFKVFSLKVNNNILIQGLLVQGNLLIQDLLLQGHSSYPRSKGSL